MERLFLMFLDHTQRRFVQNPPLWSTNSKSTFYHASCTRQSV